MMPGDSVIVTRVNVLSTGKAGAGSSKVPGRPLQQWSRVWIEAPPPISVGARTLTLVAEESSNANVLSEDSSRRHSCK